MPVAIYARVSTEEQRERQSIETQRVFGHRFCELHTLPVFRVYSDDGVSGTVPLEKRTEGSKILADAKQGKFDQLLVYRLDRLGRETRLILNAVEDFKKAGVRVRSMTEEFDSATPTGMLMLTMLAGFASHEREVIRERSVAGTTRVAESGVWMGGIVPFGYRKEGTKRDCRLVVSSDPIPGQTLSEADVIREVFHMAAVEGKSCRVIAERLNALRIPCAYTRDDRLTIRGKRRERTSGVWRPGRVRGLITNKTYMGTHEFGKRSAKKREIIPRKVTPIISEEIWMKAQETLHSNLLFSMRGAKTKYLLRGMIKCGLCGFTYIGLAANRKNGKHEFYYRCNSAHSPQIYMARERCESKAIRGDELEAQVWADVESFLRNPKPVLEKLRARLDSDARGTDQIKSQINRLEELLAEKVRERSRVVGLFRRARLTDAELDAQLEEIGKEEAGLETQLDELRAKIAGADSIGANMGSAETLLEKLGKRLTGTLSWEQKRRLVEILVASIRVHTTESFGVKQAEITVNYRFSQPDQIVPVVLPQSYGTGKVIRIPVKPQTVGDHIRLRRLGLKQLQKDVAEEIGVELTSVHNWESNRSVPEIRFMPAIIRFLGYNPLPEAAGWGGKLVRHRTMLGLSQKESAQRLGVDPSTLAKWERGEKEPTGAFLARVKGLLAADAILTAGAQLAG